MQQKEGIVSVNAIAGAGKSFSCKAIVEAVKPRNGFYTAFNRAIVQDSASKFGHLIECKTIHSLAYRHLRPKKRIRDITYDDITEDISMSEKRDIINAINSFFLSSCLDYSKFLSKYEMQDDLKPLVVDYTNQMLDGKINPTFNFMLKVLHYDLATKRSRLHKDLLLADEVQDFVPVSFEIFKLIESPKKVVLGDKHQNIYGFMNTINVFNHLVGDTKMRLTKSFRCSPDIAERVEAFGQKHLDIDFMFKGNEGLDDKEKTAYLTRTNSSLIRRMIELMDIGKRFTLIRKTSEIFEFPIAVYMAALGKPVFKNELKYLEREYNKASGGLHIKTWQYYGHLREVFENDQELMSAVALLEYMALNRINIFELRKAVDEMEPDQNTILSTAHSYKGLEADTVFISDDLNWAVESALENKVESPEQELNLYYVATSRAKHKLYGANYAYESTDFV